MPSCKYGMGMGMRYCIVIGKVIFRSIGIGVNYQPGIGNSMVSVFISVWQYHFLKSYVNLTEKK